MAAEVFGYRSRDRGGERWFLLTEKRWFSSKRPRGDTNEVGEKKDEVTVTSGLHAQAERTKKQTEKRELHPVEAQTKIRSRSQVMLLNHAQGS